MLALPPMPDVPPDQRATLVISPRYDDVAQDGRVTVCALPQAIADVAWAKLLAKCEVVDWLRDSNIIPILVRLVMSGDEAPVSMHGKLRVDGCYGFARTEAADGTVDKLLLNMWADITGDRGITYGPPPPNAGEAVTVGRVFAEHVFTRPFAPPAERKVTRLGLVGFPDPPEQTWLWRPPQGVAELPLGARALDEELQLDAAPIVFGVCHTDSNQHVNSLAYARLFEEAALRRIAAVTNDGRPRLARYLELGYRKPFFAGESARVFVQAFVLDGKPGAVGFFAPDAGGRGGGSRPHCFARVVFDR